MVEIRQIEEHRTLEQLDAAAGVGGFVLEQVGADAVGPARSPAFAARVLAVDAPAGIELDRGRRFVAHRQQLGDVGGIILAVAVERRDPRAARGLDAGAQCRALPALRDVPQHAQFGELRLRRGQHGQRVVAAQVVDVDDLEIDLAAQRGGNFAEQRDDIVTLVVHGHDDG